MRNRLITVFGGTGFIGRYVIRRLAARGARLRVPCRNPTAHAVHLQPLGDVGQIAVEPADLARPGALDHLLAGSHAAVNLIGILYETRRQTFAEIHGALPGRIAEAARAAGVERLAHVSAIGADPASPAAYGRSKAEGEARVRAAFPRATILRPSIVIGPEDDFFNRFATLARISPALPLIGGRTRFQPVYVDDVAAAIEAALEREDAPGRTYELGGPEVYSFEELLREMLDVIGRRRMLVPVPSGLARLQAAVLECLPVPPLTRDQLALLQVDNVVAEGAAGLADLGVTPTPIELIMPQYLARHRGAPVRTVHG